MEYCAARSLLEITRELKRGLNDREMACALRQATKALAYLHEHKRVHRDVKSSNLLMQPDGTLKLADFGVAGELTATVARRHTMIGSPYWMSPEVIQDTGHDQKADIWSLGITAIELAELQPPHFELPPVRVVLLIPTSKPPELKHKEQHSPALSDLIARCLVIDPEKRATAQELLQMPFVAEAEHCPNAHTHARGSSSATQATEAADCECALAAIARVAERPASPSDQMLSPRPTTATTSNTDTYPTGNKDSSLSASSRSSTGLSVSSEDSFHASDSCSSSEEEASPRAQRRRAPGKAASSASATATTKLGTKASSLLAELTQGQAASEPLRLSGTGLPECPECVALKQRIAELETKVAELTAQQLQLTKESATYKGQLEIYEQLMSFVKK